MFPHVDAIQRCLIFLQSIVPYQYGQWLIEDPESHDYRVIASVVPAGEVCYDIAHRTGVIGQVFRMQKSILSPDVRSHPLYDAFDKRIDWEFCLPVLRHGEMLAAINLEGTGDLETRHEVWSRICDVVDENTQCRPLCWAPLVDGSCLVQTRRIVIRAGHDDYEPLEIVERAKAIARGGETTLLVGHYPDLLRGRTPTMDEASHQGLGVSYCYFGVERRLDLLATGAVTQRHVLEDPMDWWETSIGRYAFVLV
jgi:hypothetical protein